MDCPACGGSVPPEARFCPTCGHALVTRPDERRVATLLFADLVGFTGIAESADPEQVKRLVDTCFDALSADVTAYGGRVDKIVGDEIVAIFGAPVAHEDDAERAVRCGLQMQRTLADLADRLGVTVRMRVGVNTGEVLVGALRGEITAMGDAVNTASRLETMAEPGWVVVGASTYAATQEIITYESLGARQVKGRGEPVEAWHAMATLAPPGRRRRARTPIVGRDAELAMLRGVLDAAQLRRRAHFVVVSADAGVGKSRLIGEIVREAEECRDARVLRTHCVPYGEEVWYPIAELIRNCCSILPDDPPTSVREAVVRAIGASDHPADETEVERTTRGLLYLLGHPEAMTDVEPARAREDAALATQQLLSAIARSQPLVVAVADLHWADDVVLEVLERIVEGMRALPFTLLASARPELLERWTPSRGRHNFTLLNLDPLDDDAVAALASELLGSDVDPKLVTLLRDRSGGNPFFVEELAALLRESGPDAAPTILKAGKLPATLRGLVAARLDALGPAERAVLEDCAVVGASGSVDSVRVLVDARGDTIDVREALLALDGRELIALDDDEFHFPSEVVRTVAYGTLAKAERARRHATLAEWLGAESDGAYAERAAYHYGTVAELVAELGPVQGVPVGFTDRALEVLLQAASRANAAELWRSAARLYDQCFRMLPSDVDDELRWQVQLGRAQAHAEYRDLAAAAADIDDVLEEAPPESHYRARALTVLAEVKQMEGDYPASFATVDEALDLWRTIGDEHGLATALRARGRTFMFTGDLQRAGDDFGEALAVYRRLGDRRGEAWALGNLATTAFFQGESDRADEHLQAAMATFDDLGDWGGRSFASALLAWVRFMQGRLDEAEKLALEQLPESEARGDRYVAGLLEMLLGNVALWRGDASQAFERARQAVGRFRALGDPWAIGQATGIEVRAQAACGEIESAIDRLNAGEAIGMAGLPIDILRVHVLVHVGDPEALPSALHVAGREGLDDRTLGTEAVRALGLALLQAGRVDEAVSHLSRLDRGGKAGFADAAALALALVAAGRLEEVDELVARSLDNGTYLDRFQLGLAEAFAHVQRRDPTAAASFDALVATIDATESRLDQAIVQLARFHAWRALERDDTADAEREANARMEAIGAALSGWSTVFALAAGTAPR